MTVDSLFLLPCQLGPWPKFATHVHTDEMKRTYEANNAHRSALPATPFLSICRGGLVTAYKSDHTPYSGQRVAVLRLARHPSRGDWAAHSYVTMPVIKHVDHHDQYVDRLVPRRKQRATSDTESGAHGAQRKDLRCLTALFGALAASNSKIVF
eukprot:3251445-Pleurochrysis_carterae.AAC.1